MGVLRLRRTYERDDTRQCDKHREFFVRRLQWSYERDDTRQCDKHRGVCVQWLQRDYACEDIAVRVYQYIARRVPIFLSGNH